MNLLDDLKWRHACKGMTGEKIDNGKVDRILEAINLAPTSLGLQAFKVFVIENHGLKERIYTEACMQQPVKACSHLLLFATYTQITQQYLDQYFELIKEKRNPGEDWCINYRNRINGFLEKNYNDMEEWLRRQVYIALGFACVAAAHERVESVPIEGFDRNILNKILDLPSQHLSAVVLLPLGVQDSEADWLYNTAKVRKNCNDLFETIL